VTHNSITMLDAALTFCRGRIEGLPTHTIRNGACTCGGAKDCSPGKHPIGVLAPRGVLNATGDPTVVRRWWQQVPDANVAIATGRNSNLVVVDVDGPIGEETLAKIERKYGSNHAGQDRQWASPVFSLPR
jgi:Bifunctional DNA primase/polymerase, N-terminal